MAPVGLLSRPIRPVEQGAVNGKLPYKVRKEYQRLRLNVLSFEPFEARPNSGPPVGRKELALQPGTSRPRERSP